MAEHKKTWPALPPWTSLASKASLRTRILFNNNAPHVTTTKSHSPEAWGWGFLRGIECPSGWGPHACDQPPLLGGDGASVDLKEFIHLPFRINFPHFPVSTQDKEEMLITSVQNSSLRLSMLLQERQKIKRANYTQLPTALNFCVCVLCKYSLFKIACMGLWLARRS